MKKHTQRAEYKLRFLQSYISIQIKEIDKTSITVDGYDEYPDSSRILAYFTYDGKKEQISISLFDLIVYISGYLPQF